MKRVGRRTIRAYRCSCPRRFTSTWCGRFVSSHRSWTRARQRCSRSCSRRWRGNTGPRCSKSVFSKTTCTPCSCCHRSSTYLDLFRVSKVRVRASSIVTVATHHDRFVGPAATAFTPCHPARVRRSHGTSGISDCDTRFRSRGRSESRLESRDSAVTHALKGTSAALEGLAPRPSAVKSRLESWARRQLTP
jgi:hypothetical protein